MQGKSAVWSHLLTFQLECEEIEDDPSYSQDTNSLSPQAGITLLTHRQSSVINPAMKQLDVMIVKGRL